MKRTNVANTLAIAVATAFALGIAPTAQAADKGCSNATLKGTFAYRITGFVTPPPQVAGIFAVPATIKGTYTVNPGCTGSFTLQISPVGLTTHSFFAIDDCGAEFQAIQTDPGGGGVTGIARRQFPVGDWRQ